MNPKPKFFKTPADFNKWLNKNHTKKSEQWVGYYKVATKKPSISWTESVEEAICYGWIDGLRKTIDEESYMIRFTPRKENSIWSSKNMTIIKKLQKEKRMKPAGNAIFQKRKAAKTSIYAYENEKVPLSKSYENLLKKNKKAAKWFYASAPSYQKTATHWVMRAKQEATQLRRLNELIQSAENGECAKPFRRKK